MNKTKEDKNQAVVLEAFDTLFNKRDYAVALNFWSPNYIQHSAHIAPGREGLFELVKKIPATLRYENQFIMARGDFLMLHGAFQDSVKESPIGSSSILSEWKMEFSRSIGMSFRTRRQRKHPSVGCPCSETSFLPWGSNVSAKQVHGVVRRRRRFGDGIFHG